MATWEYATVPLIVHATKQILDQWGEDGWELVQVLTGPGRQRAGRLPEAGEGLSMSAVEDRLAELGLTVPDVADAGGGLRPGGPGRHAASTPPASCRWCRRAGADRQGRRRPRARVRRRTPRSSREVCALNAIAAVKSVVGDLDKVTQVVKVVGFVASDPAFTGQPGVVNGASELLGKAFGDAGVHARSAVGVAVLPLDAPVEVEIVVAPSRTDRSTWSSASSRSRDFPVGARPGRDAWLDAPDRPPSRCRPSAAATVMFVRDRADGEGGVEVFMLRRVATMEFAPRMMVFPGGGVDPRDADPAPAVGRPDRRPSGRPGCRLDEDAARELVVAAVREVFEECGVLLAGPTPDEVIADVSGAHWQRGATPPCSRGRPRCPRC